MTLLIYSYFASLAFLMFMTYICRNKTHRFTLYDLLIWPSYPNCLGPEYVIACTKWVPVLNVAIAVLFLILLIISCVAELRDYILSSNWFGCVKAFGANIKKKLLSITIKNPSKN